VVTDVISTWSVFGSGALFANTLTLQAGSTQMLQVAIEAAIGQQSSLSKQERVQLATGILIPAGAAMSLTASAPPSSSPFTVTVSGYLQ